MKQWTLIFDNLKKIDRILIHENFSKTFPTHLLKTSRNTEDGSVGVDVTVLFYEAANWAQTVISLSKGLRWSDWQRIFLQLQIMKLDIMKLISKKENRVLQIHLIEIILLFLLILLIHVQCLLCAFLKSFKVVV